MPLLAKYTSPLILKHIGEIMTISNQRNQQKATKFTVPGMDETSANRVISTLDNRMVALFDLALTLKHVHWNVVGPNFIGIQICTGSLCHF